MTLGLDWVDYEIENTWSPEKTTYTNPAIFLLGKGSYLDDTLIANLGLRGDYFEVEVTDPAGRSEDQSRLTTENWACLAGNRKSEVEGPIRTGLYDAHC